MHSTKTIKFVLAALLALATRVDAAGTITDVQNSGLGSNVSTRSATVSGVVTGGCILTQMIEFNNSAAVKTHNAPTDDKSNSYTQLTNTAFNSSIRKLSSFYSCNVTGGASVVVTQTTSASTTNLFLFVWATTAHTYDANVSTTLSGTCASTTGTDQCSMGPVTPAASAILIGGMACNAVDIGLANGTNVNTTGVNGFTATFNTNSRNMPAGDASSGVSGYKVSASSASVAWNSLSPRACIGWVASFSGNAGAAGFSALTLAP